MSAVQLRKVYYAKGLLQKYQQSILILLKGWSQLLSLDMYKCVRITYSANCVQMQRHTGQLKSYESSFLWDYWTVTRPSKQWCSAEVESKEWGKVKSLFQWIVLNCFFSVLAFSTITLRKLLKTFTFLYVLLKKYTINTTAFWRTSEFRLASNSRGQR